MLRGYRIAIIAAFGWLSLAASSPPKKSATNNNAAPQDETTKAANTIATAVAKAEETPEKDRGCDQGKDERNSDLCAQWKAADAARDAAKYAFWSLWIGITGTVLLVWTLLETRKAAIREQRAYVRVEPAPSGSIEAGKPVCIPMNAINYGTTPAVDLSIMSVAVVRPPDWNWSNEPGFDGTADQVRPRATLHPDSPFLFKVEMDGRLPKPIYESIMEGRAVVFARGTILYRDVFGKKRKTTFQIEFHGRDEEIDGGRRVRIASEGNDFT